MRDKGALFLILVMLVVVISGSLVYWDMQNEFLQVVKFKNSNIIAPEIDENGTAIIYGLHSAIITVDIEKIQDVKIDEIIIKTSLTNSKNGQFLLIDKNTILTDFEKYSNFDSVGRIDSGFVQMGVGSTTGPTPIMVTGVDSRIEKFADTLNVIMYVNDVEMDRLSYDIVVDNSEVP